MLRLSPVRNRLAQGCSLLSPVGSLERLQHLFPRPRKSLRGLKEFCPLWDISQCVLVLQPAKFPHWACVNMSSSTRSSLGFLCVVQHIFCPGNGPLYDIIVLWNITAFSRESEPETCPLAVCRQPASVNVPLSRVLMCSSSYWSHSAPTLSAWGWLWRPPGPCECAAGLKNAGARFCSRQPAWYRTKMYF